MMRFDEKIDRNVVEVRELVDSGWSSIQVDSRMCRDKERVGCRRAGRIGMAAE